MTLINNINLKKDIIIGTAQLGENYGIANTNKNFDSASRLDFLDSLYENGFNLYDTAYAYKNSHRTIGDWAQKRKVKPVIYTKLPKLNNTSIKEIFSIVDRSLKELKINKIEGLLLHNPKDWNNTVTRKSINNVLNKKLIKSFGLSIYNEDDLYIDKNIQIIQAPANIFNQHFFYSDKLNDFYLNNGEVHIRSIFNQGLLLMKYENIPNKLESLKKPLYYLHNFAKEINIDLPSLAILCVKKILPNAKIIIGLDNINHVEDLKSIEKKFVKNTDIEEILKFGKKNYNALWDPRTWK